MEDAHDDGIIPDAIPRGWCIDSQALEGAATLSEIHSVLWFVVGIHGISLTAHLTNTLFDDWRSGGVRNSW